MTKEVFTMALPKIADQLNSLIKLDVDAMHSYLQAIQHIDYTPVREKLGQFLEDHERHAVKLAELVKGMGAESTEFSRDFKGFFIEGFTSLMSATGITMALEAMRMNEKLTTRTYKEALDSELPANVRMVVGENYGDERRHLDYIEQVLSDRPWERL